MIHTGSFLVPRLAATPQPPATPAPAPQQPPQAQQQPARHGIVGTIKGGAAKGFVMTLDIRVPTTTPMISEERRQQILSTVQPGDIILETDNAYPGWQRMEFWTMRSTHTHAAMYEGDGKFIEATTPDGVQRTDLKEYLHGNMMVTLVRPDYKTTQDRDAAIDYCRSQMGKPYSDAFDLKDDKAQYCAGLVYKALQAMPNKMDAPLVQVLGRPAVAPDAFMALPNAQKVYSDGSNFWKNQLSHWPVGITAVGSAVAAGMHFGPLAGVAGFVGGLAVAICVGNKIQTGHFGLTGTAK